MRERQARRETAERQSGWDRGAIAKMPVYVEDGVNAVAPDCADLIRRARLALADPQSGPDPRRFLR